MSLPEVLPLDVSESWTELPVSKMRPTQKCCGQQEQPKMVAKRLVDDDGMIGCPEVIPLQTG